MDLVKVEYLTVNKKVLKTFFYDLLFYAAILIGFLLFAMLMGRALLALETLDYQNILTINPVVADTNLSVLQGVFLKMIGVILLFLIYALFAFTFFKGLIWTTLTEAKFTSKYYRKTFWANLLYGIILFVLLIWVLARLKDYALAIIIIPIFMHFNALTYYFFKDESKVFKSIGKAFKFTFTKIKYYLLPYILIIFLFYALSYLTNIFLNRLFVTPYLPLISLIFLAFYATILRNYFKEIIHNIISKKR